MPSLGFGELVLVIIAVIIFVKPKDLPKFFKNLGNFYSEIQRGYSRIKHMTEETLQDISKSEVVGSQRDSDIVIAGKSVITVPNDVEPNDKPNHSYET